MQPRTSNEELAQLVIDFGSICNEIALMKENRFARYRATKVRALDIKKSQILDQICAQIKHVSSEVQDRIKVEMKDKWNLYLPDTN